MRVKVRTATGSHNSAETPASNIAIARCSSASRSVQEMPSIAHLRVEAPHDDRACDVKVLLKCAGFVREFDGRFCTHNGLIADIAPCPLCAKPGSRGPYSITSSARASKLGGTVRPSAFAVLRLIKNSNFVGCSTGISP